MSAPPLDSRWLDTGVRNVPPSVADVADANCVIHRIVEVVGPVTNGRSVAVVGRWQQHRNGSWEDLAVRPTSADVSTFGRRYQPLEES